MSTATGYFVAGSSWLHRRHPLTKILGVALVLLATFLLPPIVLPIMAVGLVVIAWSAGLLRPTVRAMRIPALLLTSIVVVNALFFPGATDRLATLGPFSVTREGLTFGLVSAGRIVVAFLAMVTFLFTTLADDLLEALVSRGASHRLAFVVLSAVQMVPRMQERAGSILLAQQARGLPVTGSFVQRIRALVPLIGPVILGSLVDVRERTFALEARGFGARPGRTAYRIVHDPPLDRVLRPLLGLACLAVGVVAVTGDLAMTAEPTVPVATGDPLRTEDPLRIEDLEVRYPARRDPALRDVTLSVHAGERVGVAGRTGAGKSTLALTAAGFIPRVVRAKLGGTVTIAGVNATDADATRLLGRVGIVFATPANQLSASKLTVREELAFGLENLGMPRAEMDPRIDAVLERLAIEHLADREPFSLSGGEQQRVAIASIIAMGTDILVLDEPTAQLDPAGTASVADLIDSLARSGTTILCAEHAPTVMGRMDRCLVLDEGRPVALDRPGAALTAAERDVGLCPPTLVRLANIAGVAPGLEFDEAAIAAAFGAMGHSASEIGDPATAAADRGGDVAADAGWDPGRERPPVRIEIKDLAHTYPNGVDAVRGVSLSIEPGEAVVILGQNGSGKTTLVKHLNGLLRSRTGQIVLGGTPTDGLAIDTLAAIVGFVFQNPDDQLFERSVEREVAFGPKNLRRPPERIPDLVAHSLEAVGLTDVRSTNPYDLDLSRRKLVALAGVLAMDPAVLVLDEPTTGQDAAGIERVGAVVRAYRDAGRSVIAITHDMEFAATNFTRVVVMRLGEVVADGPPAVIFAPDHRDLLATTGLLPPPAARIAAAIGLTAVPLDTAGLLVALRSTSA